MKIIRDFQQNSLEWLVYRAGKVTASEFGQFMTTDFELRKGQMLDSYIARKCAGAAKCRYIVTVKLQHGSAA